jgi:histidine triad (HIT) family protein
MNQCIFCKIVNKEIPADIIFENEKIIVFRDINPKAPVHFLIVSKKHISSLNEIEEEDKELLSEIFFVVKEIAKKVGIIESGYKTVINVGKGGGQEVPHLHIHLLGGWKN